MEEKAEDEKLDWINKEKLDTDNKLLKVEDLIEGDGIGEEQKDDNTSDLFRVTMAMNGFENEKSMEVVPSRGKILKKKKKKATETKPANLGPAPSD